tara:strand:+ start:2880 stop:3443 length:564 start_codon:yes stop_codon:yes gene_type:complete
MNEHKTDQELLLLAEQLEGRLSERTPEISHLAQQVSQMKEVFNNLPEEKLSQHAKQRIFAVLHRAFQLRFSPETAQQKETDFQQLYQILKGFTQENLESIITFWKNWAAQEQIEANEREFISTLQFSARLANECSEEEFLGALIHDEVPPIELSDEELDCLNGGIHRTSFERVFSPQFLSSAFKHKF